MNRQTKVNVDCQYFENYDFFDGGVNWKPKGGFRFSFTVDLDDWMYDETRFVEIFKKVIESKNDGLNRFDYLSHEREIETNDDITKEVMELYMKGV